MEGAMLKKTRSTKRRLKLPEVIVYLLLSMGSIAIVLSYIFTSFILAFAGLGLTFWSVILVFLKTTRYVKADLFEATPVSSLKSIDQVIAHFNCEGKGIYLPQRYLGDFKGGKVFIPFEKELVLPSVEEVAKGEVYLENPHGLCLTPSGLGLVNLFEKKLETDFSRVDVNYLVGNLPKLFIEDLEIAEDFEMNPVGNMIHVRITGSVYNNMCVGVGELSSSCKSFGCPLCSSLACALAKATGKPIVIEKSGLSEDGRVIQVYYRIIENGVNGFSAS